jgi:chaperonin GroEL
MIYEKSKAKKIIYSKQEIQHNVVSTIDMMASIVGATLGPGGRPVLIERDGMPPLITKDGVTVAKNLGVDKAECNIVVEAAKEICLKTAKEAGDGTTSAIVLASAIVDNGLKFLNSNPKYNPQRLSNELSSMYSEVVIPFLEKVSVKVSSEEELLNVATISANGDKRIAEAAVKAVMAAGEDGHVLIEEAQGDQIKVETMDGFIVTSGLKDVGSIGRAFINDRANQQVKMDKGLCFMYDGTINDLKVPGIIQSLIEGTHLYGKPIIVFAHGFADVVLDAFAKTTKGGYTIVPVKTPMSGVANSRSSFLLDMSAYTGGAVLDPGNVDAALEARDLSVFGLFESAKIGMYESLVVNTPNLEKIEARIAELKHLMSVSPSDFDKMHIKAAIAKLTGGVATIWVGGGSEIEAREKKDRMEDAVEAIKSAIAEGVIPGGASIYLVLSEYLVNHKDKKPSWDIMIEALKRPFSLLLHNCGEDVDGFMSKMLDVARKAALEEIAPSLVFNANSRSLDDPWSCGVIEPKKVARSAIGNALSVTSLLVTLGGIVVVPRDANLENQLELSRQAFREMMNAGSIME